MSISVIEKSIQKSIKKSINYTDTIEYPGLEARKDVHV